MRFVFLFLVFITPIMGNDKQRDPTIPGKKLSTILDSIAKPKRQTDLNKKPESNKESIQQEDISHNILFTGMIKSSQRTIVALNYKSKFYYSKIGSSLNIEGQAIMLEKLEGPKLSIKTSGKSTYLLLSREEKK